MLRRRDTPRPFVKPSPLPLSPLPVSLSPCLPVYCPPPPRAITLAGMPTDTRPEPLYTIDTYGELLPYVHREWLLTNGLGSFSMGTMVGCNTRRYHGLLCAASTPPVGRVMAVNRVGEILLLDGQTDRMLEFSVNQFHGNVHPRGDRYLRRFDPRRGRPVGVRGRGGQGHEGTSTALEAERRRRPLRGRPRRAGARSGWTCCRSSACATSTPCAAAEGTSTSAPSRARWASVRGTTRRTSRPTPARFPKAATGGTATFTRSKPSAARTTPKTSFAPAGSPSRPKAR